MSKSIVLLVLVIMLLACGGADDRKAAYMEKGKAYLNEENYDKARVEFLNTLQIDPKDVEGRYFLAQTLEKLQDWRGAAGHYQAILGIDKQHVGARIHLAQLYLLSRNADKVFELADEALKIEPDNFDALTLRGSAYAAKSDLKAAMNDAQAAIKINRDNPQTIALLSSLYIANKQVDKAVAFLEESVARIPNNTSLRILLTNTYVANNRSENAIIQLKKVIEIEPEVLAHQARLASLYIKFDQKDNAEQLLRSAVDNNPDSTDAKLVFIDFLARNKSKNEAITSLSDFIKKSPQEYKLRFALAGLYEAGGEADKAKLVYEKIIDDAGTEPQALNAKVKLANLYIRNNDKNNATKLVDAVLAENQKDFDALMLRGKIAMSNNDPLRAINDFRSVLKDQPNSKETLKLLAKAHVLNKENEQAVETLKQLITLDVKDSLPRMDLAKLYLSIKQYDNARNQLRKVLENDSDNVDAQKALFDVYLSKGELANAQKLAKDIKFAKPDNYLGYYLEGIIALRENKLADGANQLEEAFSKAPGEFEVLARLTQVYLVQKKPENALKKLESVRKKRPKDAKIQNLIGEVYVVQKSYDKAINSFKQASKLKPSWTIPYQNQARVYLIRKDTKNAVSIYKQGLDATNNNVTLAIALASLYEQNGQVETAIKEYENLLSKNSALDLAANNLAMLLIAERGDQQSLDRAQELVDRFRHSTVPDFLDSLGWVLYKRGSIDEAITFLEKAMKIAPDMAVINYHLGVAYADKKMNTLAVKFLGKAVEGDKDFDGKKEAQDLLNQLSTNS